MSWVIKEFNKDGFLHFSFLNMHLDVERITLIDPVHTSIDRELILT